MDFEVLKPEIAKIGLKHKLEFVALFGSQARGNTHPRSDIDIAIISREKIDILKIIDDFYDLFSREDVEVIDLSKSSPTMMKVVVEDDKLLYEKETGIFDEWKLYAIKIWMETSWLRNLQNRILVEWAKNN